MDSRTSGAIDNFRCSQLEPLTILANSMPAGQLTNINEQNMEIAHAITMLLDFVPATLVIFIIVRKTFLFITQTHSGLCTGQFVGLAA